MPKQAVQNGAAGNGGQQPGHGRGRKNKKRAHTCHIYNERGHVMANCPAAYMYAVFARMQALGVTPEDYLRGPSRRSRLAPAVAAPAVAASAVAAANAAHVDPVDAEEAPVEEAPLKRPSNTLSSPSRAGSPAPMRPPSEDLD